VSEEKAKDIGATVVLDREGWRKIFLYPASDDVEYIKAAYKFDNDDDMVVKLSLVGDTRRATGASTAAGLLGALTGSQPPTQMSAPDGGIAEIILVRNTISKETRDPKSILECLERVRDTCDWLHGEVSKFVDGAVPEAAKDKKAKSSDGSVETNCGKSWFSEVPTGSPFSKS
jgi:hypothetical protein